MWGIIATWTMATDGVKRAGKQLDANHSAVDAGETCVKSVEQNPLYTSVGLGGLPNMAGEVEVDAAVMDGDTLSFGAVASMKNFLHPCSIAKTLLNKPFNNFLVGQGAEHYAQSVGFETTNLLTDSSLKKWETHKKEVEHGLSPYIGHDTVCAVSLDHNHSMATVTSTSGLFYKQPGRIGDSSIPGSGYYVDSTIGGAAATGLGEDIMKGSTSYEIVRLMEQGYSPQEACEKAVLYLNDKLIMKRGKAGDISVVAMNTKGDFGAATNIESFPFVVMTETLGFKHFEASYGDGLMKIKVLV